jgi:16S rRNA (guanine527-N7)-methyltransferase
MTNKQFIEELEKLNIFLTEEQKQQLETYYELLIEWNQKINLTAITEKEEVYLKHFYDSLTLIKKCDLTQNIKLCDIGTGAGFPGIVLKIVFPNLKVTLVDALNKRIQFLNIVIDTLKLKNIETIHDRMEEYSKKNIEKFDIVTARAVSHISNLLEYSASSVKIGGMLIFMKGDMKEELKEYQNATFLLNLEYVSKEEFYLPVEKSKRTLICFKKIGKTPKKYPRKYADIKKNRL